jgi:hypothetical protein
MLGMELIEGYGLVGGSVLLCGGMIWGPYAHDPLSMEFKPWFPLDPVIEL